MQIVIKGLDMDNFDTFWSIYPRKKEKKRARVSFNRLPKKTQIDCIEGVRKYIKQIQIQGTEPQFIKHPSTFINGENWEDDFETDVIVNKKIVATDFKLAPSGNARLGFCTSCGDCNTYDKFQIHMENSRCCGVDLKPTRS